MGALLDLEIRRRTSNESSLDDVMRDLYADFYRVKGRGFTEAEFQEACEKRAGGSLDEFFERYVYGTDELPYEEFLAAAGLELTRAADDEDDSGEKRGYLGVSTREEGGRFVVTRVLRDTPAYEAGLNVNDEIIAIDGLRVHSGSFGERIGAHHAGDEIRLTIARDDYLREIEVVLAERIEWAYTIQKTEEPTGEQVEVYEGWLGDEWEE